ncbi:hypothetical protein D3C71_2186740 [compost metagenome]
MVRGPDGADLLAPQAHRQQGVRDAARERADVIEAVDRVVHHVGGRLRIDLPSAVKEVDDGHVGLL